MVDAGAGMILHESPSGWTWPAALAAARAEARRLRHACRQEMEARRARRWPFEALQAHLETVRRRRALNDEPGGPQSASTLTVLADLVSVSYYTAHRWWELGRLTDGQAERCAFALGLHPANVWTDWYDPDLAVSA